MSISFTALRLDGRLEPTDLSADAGEFIALIGPNGSGKTSLMRTMADISGSASKRLISGEPYVQLPPAQRSKKIGLLPATRSLSWPIPVRDLLALAPAPIDADRLVERLELESFLDRPSNQLSTGERARVLLARALASEPTLLLLDEPLANLDPYWALTIRDLLAEEAKEGRVVVAAMHDLALVDGFDRVLLMHEGRLVADGPPFEILGCDAFRAAFRLEPHAGGWRPV